MRIVLLVTTLGALSASPVAAQHEGVPVRHQIVQAEQPHVVVGRLVGRKHGRRR